MNTLLVLAIRSHLGGYYYETSEKQPSEHAIAFKIIDK
jgi:hypothetical protein